MMYDGLDRMPSLASCNAMHGQATPYACTARMHAWAGVVCDGASVHSAILRCLTCVYAFLIIFSYLFLCLSQGELRYLDSNEEEQRRGITMKSSSIALLYVPGSATRPEVGVSGGGGGATGWERPESGAWRDRI